MAVHDWMSEETLKNLSIGAWLSKDLGWMLLCPAICWPAAAVAIPVEAWLMAEAMFAHWLFASLPECNFGWLARYSGWPGSHPG